jgi:hypothetical protein
MRLGHAASPLSHNVQQGSEPHYQTGWLRHWPPEYGGTAAQWSFAETHLLQAGQVGHKMHEHALASA